MATIKEVYDIWAKFDFDRAVSDTVVQNQDEIVQLNKDQLLDDGFNRQQKKLKQYKSPPYAKMKNRLNPFPGYGNPDLYKKGNFFRGFKVKVHNKTTYEVFSTDSKNAMLVKNYGADIFGLGINKIAELNDGGFRADLQQRVRNGVKL